MRKTPRPLPGIWTLDVMSDLSSAFITHYRCDGTHTCHSDDGTTMSGDAHPSAPSYDPARDTRIPYRLAQLLIRRWKRQQQER